jgi:hypothetical protein
VHVELWRSTDPKAPILGYDTAWSTSESYARWYMNPSIIRGEPSRLWGGDGLFRAVVDVNPVTLLDLRVEPWVQLLDLFGVDRDDYPGAEDYEVIGSRVPSYERKGYLWVAFQHAEATDDWLYIGREDIPARLVETRADLAAPTPNPATIKSALIPDRP